MRPDVIVFSTFFPPEKGAAPNRIRNMCQGLKDCGLEVSVVTALLN